MAPKATILIVDDNEAARDTLDALLFSEDRVLVFAEDGPTALAKIADVRPDLVLLDVMMPEMDGYEVCERIRQMPDVREVPVIMVTALDDRDSRLKGLSAGADDFVSKPFDSVELRTRVRTVLRLDRYRKLLAEKERLLWVLDSSDDGYAIVDCEDRILYTNAKAADLLQLADSDDDAFVDTVARHFDLRPQAAWAAWPSASDEEEGDGVRYLIRTEDSLVPALWVRVDVELARGEAGQHIIRLRDVTRETEEQIHAWTFQEAVSHKLNTPMTALIGGVDLLAEALADMPDTDSDATAMLDLVQQSTDRVAGAVRDVLAFTGGQAEPDDRRHVTAAEMTALTKEAATQIGLTRVTVTVADSAQDLVMPVSTRAMSAILIELLENARKFHPEGRPTVDVRATCGDNGAVTVSVMDDGVSLPGEVLDKVWHPYFQYQKRWTGEVAGMGLGLSQVARMVWRGGGTVSMVNRPDGPGMIVHLIVPHSV